MVKTFKKLPTSEFYNNIDSVTKRWMHENYIQDKKDNFEMLKNVAYIICSFINPEYLKKILNQDGTKNYSSTDEEFNKLSEEIRKEGELFRTKFRKKKKKINIK